jgi:Tol biopolymer transport system component
MDARGAHKRRVIRGIGEHPAWSPDGKRIVYSAYPAGLGIVSADGRGRRRIIASRLGLVALPAWR